MLKDIAFEMSYEGERFVIFATFNMYTGDFLYKNLLKTKEFEYVFKYTDDLLECDSPILKQLMNSIHLDDSKESKIRTHKSDRIKFVYEYIEPINPILCNEKI